MQSNLVVEVRATKKHEYPEAAYLLDDGFPDEGWDAKSLMRFERTHGNEIATLWVHGVGAIGYMLIRSRAPNTLHIARLIIAKPQRRRNFGSASVRCLFKKCELLNLRVEETNEAGVAFCKHLLSGSDSESAATVKFGHYRHSGRDAYEFALVRRQQRSTTKPAPRMKR